MTVAACHRRAESCAGQIWHGNGGEQTNQLHCANLHGTWRGIPASFVLWPSVEWDASASEILAVYLHAPEPRVPLLAFRIFCCSAPLPATVPMSLPDAVPPAVIEFSTNAARVGWAGSAEPEVVRKPCSGHVRDGLMDNAVAALAWSIQALESHGKSGESSAARTPTRAVLCEALWQPRSTREAWSEAAFEKHGLDAVGVLKSPVAALFAHARTTGMVIDGGSHAVDILPVQDGYPVMMGARRSTLGGTGLCAYLRKLLAEGDTEEVAASRAAAAAAYRYVMAANGSKASGEALRARLLACTCAARCLGTCGWPPQTTYT